uniref:1,2-dihydroxy-3-keto-5-methylthiopentene dioxygenase homolog n=1 Tax=Syphacia muris TaxID=451379 RepID=A0A0N5AJW5_9BILA
MKKDNKIYLIYFNRIYFSTIIMHIWHMESYICGDKRLPHHVYPPKMHTPDQLQALTGVIHYKVDLDDTVAMKKRISRVKNDRGVISSDIITINEHLADLSLKLEEFFEPVVKKEDAIYLLMDGSAYYDIEVDEDDWIRIELERGDMIVIPSGRPHRYTLTPLVSYLKALELDVRPLIIAVPIKIGTKLLSIEQMLLLY